MKRDLFDNIGDKLNQYESPVDLEMEWDGILAKQEQSKRRSLLFLFSAIAMILLLSGGCFFLTKNFQEHRLLDSKMASGSKEEVVSKSTLNDLVKTDLDTEVNAEVEVEVEVEVEITEVKSIEDPKAFEPQKASPIYSSRTNDQRVPSFSKSNLIAKEISRSNATDIKLERSSSLKPISKLESIKIDLPLVTRILNPIPSNAKIKEEAVSKKRKFELFANAGMAITRQQFKAKNSTDKEFSDWRDTHEKSLETYVYNAGVNIFLKEKSFLSIGGSYSIHFDRINFQYDAAKAFYFENVLLKRITYPGGKVTEIFGDTTIIGSKRITTTEYNKYRMLNLNASFGHYFYQKEKIRIGVTGGLSYNVSLKIEGKTYNSDAPNTALVPLTGYKKAYGFGLLGGLELDYQLAKNLFLNIRPSMSYSLSTTTKKADLLDARFYRYGINAGLKFNL